MKNLLIQPDRSIKEALKYLNEGGEKCLVVVDEERKLLGTLSDGDVRKSILNGKNTNNSIKTIYNAHPTYFFVGQYSKGKVKEIFLNNKFDLIPVIDTSEKIVEILTWTNIFGKEDVYRQKLNVPVVIMAGGRGSRLEPFTKILPKPLVPVHDKPIIEHIIESFTKVGCSDFHLTVNYKSKILKAYFEELQPSYKISFVDEHIPLGTAGSLWYLMGKFTKPFIVTNCDIIINVDYANLYDFHLKGGYDVSLVASTKEFVIPYGTCELNEDGHLSHINEKPKFDFLINTGLYVLKPDVLKLIPKNKFYHITHLIEEAKNQNKKIGVFPIDEGAWVDVGQWTEYKKAIELL